MWILFKRPGAVLMAVTMLAAMLAAMLTGCGRVETQRETADFSDRPVRVVATTSMIADLAREIGGEQVEVTGLMGPGVDPHLYKASEGDVRRMAGADVILYSGLHLEGKMTEVFGQMRQRGIPTYAVAEEGVPDSLRIVSPAFAGNYDPHVWFDVSLWMDVARATARALSEFDPQHASVYADGLAAYLVELAELHEYVRAQAQRVPQEQRVLVTAHDAFSYYGRAYGFEVRGLQGISTAAEAGTADVQDLTAFIVERRIPALFVESSVSPRSIEAVKAAVRARGFEVEIGGSLFSDALGNPGTPEGTYVGTVRHNTDTIVRALLREQAL